MFHKIKPIIIIAITFIIIILTVQFRGIASYFMMVFHSSRDYILEIEPINQSVKNITIDRENKLLFRVIVRDFMGNKVPRVRISAYEENSLGDVVPRYSTTDKDGECLVTYIPPKMTNENIEKLKNNIPIKANIITKIHKNKGQKNLEIGIKNIPIVYVHGYRESKNVFVSMNNYFEKKGFEGNFFSYDSNDKIENSAYELSNFLKEIRLKYLEKGLKVKSFYLICHSMGGLVTRYYTCSDVYWKSRDVNKLIFISTPHKGSHIASLGESIYDDDGIKDLQPDGKLLNEEFPKLFNRGLNNTIQTANILGQYDEVVEFDSASLEDWNIKTEVYNIGDNTLNVNNILNGSFIWASNHNNILSNTKIFEHLEEMLYKDLSLPAYIN